jgi:hypothetical protein
MEEGKGHSLCEVRSAAADAADASPVWSIVNEFSLSMRSREVLVGFAAADNYSVGALVTLLLGLQYL